MLSPMLIALCLRLILYLKVYLTLYQYNAVSSPYWRHLSRVYIAWKIWHCQQWWCCFSLFWKWYHFQEPVYKPPNTASQAKKKKVSPLSPFEIVSIASGHYSVVYFLFLFPRNPNDKTHLYSAHTAQGLLSICHPNWILKSEKTSWSHVSGLPIVHWKSQCHLNVSFYTPDGVKETECWKTTVSTDQLALFWNPGVKRLN